MAPGLVAGAFALALPVCAAYPTPVETRGEFEQVCQVLRTGNNPLFGEAMVGPLKANLASSLLDPESQVKLRIVLTAAEVRLGRIGEAKRLIQEALEISERSGLAADLRLDLTMMLAYAHLRSGEEENCLLRHTAASCLFPIAGTGVHVEPRESRIAGDLYLKVLEQRPDEFVARWLFNLSRMASGDFPGGVPERFRLPPSALNSAVPFPRWLDLGELAGLTKRDLSGGAVMDDFDGDGLLDMITTTSDPCGGMKALRNDGRGGFEDVTRAWGLDGQLGGLNLSQADYDGDGMLDLLVPRGAWLGEDGRIRRSLLRNDLKRRARGFVDVTAEAGLVAPAYPSQTAIWADYDSDGDLDVYIGNEAATAGANIARSGGISTGYPSQLFRNNGDGTFTDVAPQAGVANDRFTKGAAWGDYDNDGDPDLYVSNIGPNRLYRNNGDGTFTDVGPELKVLEPAEVSFNTWFFDVDNDGDLDLFVADYGARVWQVYSAIFGRPVSTGHPVLYRNDGGTFTDVSAALGLDRPHLPMGANYGDLDNDGWPDFYLGTGAPDFEALMPNVMYRNDRGRGFQDVTVAGGFGHLQKGHGVAFGDIDNDGDQDLLHQVGGAYPYDVFEDSLFENPGPVRSWITLRLRGLKANRFGVGARIEVAIREGGNRRSVHVLAGSGGSFGANSLQQEIGLGEATAIESITVRWPAKGAVQVFKDVALNRVYQVFEDRPDLVPVAVTPLRLGVGAAAEGHQHHTH